jgi:tetratricopeptide (TPR) repeat protein
LEIRKRIIKKHIVFTFLLLGTLCHANSDTSLKLVSELSFQKNQDSTLYKLYRKADSLYKTKNYTTSLKFALKVIDKSKRNTDRELTSNTNYLIARIWYSTGAYDKAIVYFQKSVAGFSKIIEEKNFLNENLEKYQIKDDFNILNGNLQIGNSYSKLYEQFIDDIEKDSLNRIYRTKALFYYDKILKSNSLSEDVLLLKSITFNNVSNIYLRDSAYIKAEEFTLKSIEIEKRIGDSYSLATGYNALSNIHFF